MTPEFSEAVDPIFVHVLGLLDRISRDEGPSAEDERERIKGWIDQAENKLGKAKEWQLAKYAVVAWIDEVLIDAPWEHQEWWTNNVLERQYFGQRTAFHQFYTKAAEASSLPNKDALEVFYVCVVLGFRGMYRDPGTALQYAQQMGLPADLETWANRTGTGIQLGQHLPRLDPLEQPGKGAPPLDGPFLLMGSVMVAGVLVALNVALWLYLYYEVYGS
jgi:type VI secretion system protein ImpK